MSLPLYRLRGVSQSYAGREVLNIEELSFEPGGITGLCGPNGAGKSTLLRLLAFLETPAQGELEFCGIIPRDLTLARRKASLLLQHPYLLSLSVFDNVAYGLRLRGQRKGLEGEVNAALDRVGLDPARYARRPKRELSGGEAQRVALAARLVLKPKALLLDEPTSSLDSASLEAVTLALRELGKGGGTSVILASHDRSWLNSLAEREVRLNNGRLDCLWP